MTNNLRTQELKVDQYRDILGPDLVSQYRKKTHEYKKKWDDRVYCPTPTEQPGGKCGEYLGGSRDKLKHTRLTSKCKKCSKKTCLACKAQPTSRSGHICEATEEEKAQEVATFEGLTKVSTEGYHAIAWTVMWRWDMHCTTRIIHA